MQTRICKICWQQSRLQMDCRLYRLSANWKTLISDTCIGNFPALQYKWPTTFRTRDFFFLKKKSELMFFRGKNLLSSPAMNQRSLMPSKNMHAWRFLRKHCTQESCTKTIGITVTNQWMHECSLFLTHLTAWAKLLTFGALPSNSTELKQTPEVKHCTLNAIYL